MLKVPVFSKRDGFNLLKTKNCLLKCNFCAAKERAISPIGMLLEPTEIFGKNGKSYVKFFV